MKSNSPFLCKNVALNPPLRSTAWRKIAMGTWRSAGDPSVYAELELDATPALAYIEQWRQFTGNKITLTHFVGRALAETIRRHPDINCIQRFGQLYPRKSIDIFYQIATDFQGDDLSGMVIRQADQKSLGEITAEMEAQVVRIRNKTDHTYKKMKSLMGSLPGWLVGPAIQLASFLLYGLNLWSPLIGSPRDSFGSAMVTSVGSLGIESAFVPLVPYSRAPLLIAVGAVKEKPIVRDGAIVIAPMVKLCATFDHRVIDGVHGAKMSRALKEIFANPESELGPPRG